ncbi:MAG: hypothetical protein JW892_09920 [Anaerolineae bacterium]|nr:hypothetical protein [Anaerolineae bacterium]
MSKSFHWYWGVLFLLLLLTRLSALDAALLAPSEAQIALRALEAAEARQWPLSPTSALLLNGNVLLFTLFGSGSGLARLLPALAGIFLALTPWLWRKMLPWCGRENVSLALPAFAAALLLLLSPIALFISRQVNATTLGAFGGGMVITALFALSFDGANRRAAWLLGAGLAIGLVGGPAFYDVFISGILAWGIWHWVEGRAPALSRECCRAAGLGLLVALLISLGLGARWNGWAGPVEGLVLWLREWQFSTPSANPLLLLLYEPLILLLAAAGLGLAIRHREPRLLALAAWAVLATLLVTLRPGAAPGTFLAPLLPLALLGGWATQYFVPSRFANKAWVEWVHAALGVVLWAFIALVLLRQAGAPQYANGLELPLVLLVLVIHGLMTAGFATLAGLRRAMTGLIWGLVVAACLLQVGFGIRAAFVAPANPAEPLVVAGVSGDVRNLRRVVEDLRIARGISPDELDLVVVDDNPNSADAWSVVHWALCSVPLRSLSAWPSGTAEMVLTLETVTPPLETRLAYSGMAFGVLLENSSGISGCEPGVFPPVCGHPLAWYFYRRLLSAPQVTRVILWSRLPETP